MNKKILIILLCVTLSVMGAETPKTQKTEILEANHFYSEQNK
jgi:hypothetical protein